MELNIPKPVFPSYPGSAVQPLTPEENSQLSSESQTSQTPSPEKSNGALVPAEFIQVQQVTDLIEEDFLILDNARKASFYVYTVQEFADALKAGTYDIFKLMGLPGTLCLILTSYEVYPRHKFLQVHYLAGENAAPHRAELKAAIWRLADEKNCDGILYMAHNPGYAKYLGGRQLSILYALER